MCSSLEFVNGFGVVIKESLEILQIIEAFTGGVAEQVVVSAGAMAEVLASAKE